MDDLDYDLPAERIAQIPAGRREDARLLVVDRPTGRRSHRCIRNLPDLLQPGDLLVANDTRVLPARLWGRRQSGGRVQMLLLEPLPGSEHPETEDHDTWLALMQASGRLRPGERLTVGGGAVCLVGRNGTEGAWCVRAEGESMRALCDREGTMPLPPYIDRREQDPRADTDRMRYQTVFAKHPGAVAAPTAGLHLTDDLLRAVLQRGASFATITLHVGLGTFQPVRCDTLDEHRMHAERYVISEDTVRAIAACRERNGRVVAVGTTTVRALEAAASQGGTPLAGAASTTLLIRPGYRFQVVDSLLTNFHLPRSTLLALVAAMLGVDTMHDVYREAINEGYRFYSYGDAMLIHGAPRG